MKLTETSPPPRDFDAELAQMEGAISICPSIWAMLVPAALLFAFALGCFFSYLSRYGLGALD